MRESGIEPRKDVYHHMIVSHSRCGNLERAMTWFHGMKASHELSSVEYSILLSLVAKMGNLRLFTAIINSIEEKNIEKSGYMYATMIRTFSRARRLDLAAEAFEEMKQRKLADTAGYNVFIDAVCTQQTPDFARAKALMTDMEDQGVPPSSTTYGTVIHHLSRRGHGEPAVQMFEEMTKRGLAPTVITYTQVMRALSRGDEPLKAIAYWERMKRQGVRSWSSYCQFSILLNRYRSVPTAAYVGALTVAKSSQIDRGNLTHSLCLLPPDQTDRYRICCWNRCTL
mmetsp:Transcript_43108/g.168746  ORF Transcript_43108/g.168746 Transcript_43108/m.168746 type:complete len:283 (+) Transcript_43108:1131-1979(+)